jgi:hypothetical protein
MSSYYLSGKYYHSPPSLSILSPLGRLHLSERGFVFEAIACLFHEQWDREAALTFLFNKGLVVVSAKSSTSIFLQPDLKNVSLLSSDENDFLSSFHPRLLALHSWLSFEYIERKKKRNEHDCKRMKLSREKKRDPPRETNVLLFGVERPFYVRCLETIYAEAIKVSFSLRQLLRDEARIVSLEQGNPTFRVYTTNRNHTRSRFHFQCHMSGYRRTNPIPRNLQFDQVYVDYLWMFSDYLLGILTRDFFDVFLHQVGMEQMPIGGRIYIPLYPAVLRRVLENWSTWLDSRFIFRLLRRDQEAELSLINATNVLDLSLLGKPSENMPEGVMITCVRETLRLHCPSKPSLLAEFLPLSFPFDSSTSRFLCLTKRDHKVSRPQETTSPNQDVPICAYCQQASLPARDCCRLLGIGQPLRQVNHGKPSFLHEDEDDTSNESSDDEQAYNLKDEKRVSGYKSLGKKKKSKKDFDTENRRIELQLKEGDGASKPGHFWGTLVISPKDPAMSSQMVGKKFRLDIPSVIKAHFSPVCYWAEKSPLSITLWFALRERPHTVCGSRFLHRISKTYGLRPTIVAADRDHFYVDRERPCVVNTHDVVGVADSTLANLIGLPPHLLGGSLLSQLDWALTDLLEKDADEMIEHALFDRFRRVVAQHNGSCPRDGKTWKRSNGVGVAEPGLFAKMATLSNRYRHSLFRLAVISHHQMLEVMLGHLPQYLKQSRNDQARLSVMRRWIEFLLPTHLQTEEKKKIMTDFGIPDAISFLFGFAYAHTDGMNGGKVGISDQVTVSTKYISDWSVYISKANQARLLENGIQLRHSSLQVVQYGRSIYDSQAAKVLGLDDIDNPLVKGCMTLNDYDFWQNGNNLDDPEHYQRFRSHFSPTMVAGNDYPFPFQSVKECSNRMWFLGSFMNVWLRMIVMYSPLVEFRHTASFVAFAMREANGQSLLIGLLESTLMRQRLPSVEDIFKDKSVESVYEWLSLLFIEKRGTSGVISCNDNRYQKVDRMLYDSERKTKAKCRKDCGLFVTFFLDQLMKLNDTEREQEGLAMLVSSTFRNERLTKEVRATVQLGCVRVTFGLQLSAGLLLTPDTYATWAIVAKSKSGFYRAIEFLCGDGTKSSLSTQQVTDIANNTVAILRRNGVYATMSWLDQGCCLFYRWHLANDQVDKRKHEYIMCGHDRAPYIPFRVKEASKIWIQFLSASKEWVDLETALSRFNGTDWCSPQLVNVAVLSNGLGV